MRNTIAEGITFLPPWGAATLLELSAHGGARLLLGERERVNGLAPRPEDRVRTLLDGVYKRCGRQGPRECGTRLQRGLYLCCRGVPPVQALSSSRLKVVHDCYWVNVSE